MPDQPLILTFFIGILILFSIFICVFDNLVFLIGLAGRGMAPESGTCSARSSSGAGGWSVDKEPEYFYGHLLDTKE